MERFNSEAKTFLRFFNLILHLFTIYFSMRKKLKFIITALHAAIPILKK